jgi:hypothetical protein
MQQNMGPLEQTLRVLTGFALLFVAFITAPPLSYAAWAGFLVFAVTGFAGKCLVYRMLGIRNG